MVEENERMYSRSSNKNTLLKIVILGDGGVGKSCLMSRFISNHFDDHSFHTIGVEFMNKTIEVGGNQYTLQVSTFPFIISYCAHVQASSVMHDLTPLISMFEQVFTKSLLLSK